MDTHSCTFLSDLMKPHRFSECKNVLDDKKLIFTEFELQEEGLNIWVKEKTTNGITAQKPNLVPDTLLKRLREAESSKAPLQ